MCFYYTFRSHLYRKHNNQSIEPVSSAEPEISSFSNAEEQDSDNADTDTEVHDLEEERKRRAALFILKTKEERMLTQTTLERILQDITG